MDNFVKRSSKRLSLIGASLQQKISMVKKDTTKDQPAATGSGETRRKKWPTVKIDYGPGYASMDDLAGVQPALIKGAIPWTRATRICPLLSGSSNGVLFVETPGGLVIVKACRQAAQEMFTSLLANKVDLRNPQIRILNTEEPEYDELCATLPKLVEEPHLRASIVSYLQGSDHLMIMEAITNCDTFLSFGEDAPKKLDDSLLQELGVIIAFDLLIGNFDRMPLLGVWDNEGNENNILFPRKPSDQTRAVMIDQICVCPSDANLQDKNLEDLEQLFSSVETIATALSLTRDFVLRNTNHDIGESGITSMVCGIQEGLHRVSHLSLDTFQQVYKRVQDAVVSDEDGSWKGSLDVIDVNFLQRRVKLFQDSPIRMKVQLTHIHGASGLANVLNAVATFSNETTCLFFDFDRTLTNGFSNSKDSPIQERIRGGQQTVDAIERIRATGAHIYVITARTPRKLVVDQLVTSFKGPQRELSGVFLNGQDPDIEELRFCDVPLAWSPNTNLYAADYQKPAAIAHALIQLQPVAGGTPVKRTALFFDDAVMNAHDVGARVGQLLLKEGRGDLVANTLVQSHWWDTFEEETGENPTMKPVVSSNTESGYQDFLKGQLADFGIDAEEWDRRVAKYASMNLPTGNEPVTKAKSVVGKLKSSAEQANLADFLFGGGKAKKSA